ncbi:hypothetical protein TWF718_005354 [Orbilia javanica]|uniref:BTB domain-containing protein n=1 Tax=Orbilia javanica TaxID=47235 RepID=A0AAN8RJB9_9PEZI
MSFPSGPSRPGGARSPPEPMDLNAFQAKLGRAKSLSQPRLRRINPNLPLESKRASVHIPVHPHAFRDNDMYPPGIIDGTVNNLSGNFEALNLGGGMPTDQSFEKTTLMKILENPKFSDITVYIGPSKVPFHLHREIIALKSGFFKDFCFTLRSSKTAVVAQISLPHLDPAIFRTITQWQYDGPLEINFTQTNDGIVNLYKAIEFLKIPDLRELLLVGMTNFCRTRFCVLNDASRETFLGTFNRLCDIVRLADLSKLITCMEVIVIHFVVLPECFLEALNDGGVSNAFVAAFIGARKNLGHWESCRKCFDKYEEEGRRRVVIERR